MEHLAEYTICRTAAVAHCEQQYYSNVIFWLEHGSEIP